VKSTDRGSAPAFLIALLAIAGIVALGNLGDSPAIAVTLLATVPLFAAIFLGPRGTIAVAVIAVACALLVTWLRSDGDYSSYIVPLVSVGVASVVALVSSVLRRGPRAGSAASSAAAAGSQPSEDIDPMSGLLNRRGAIRVLGPRNEGEDRVIAFVDCDLFGRVNEEFGREVGDEFLQAVAGRLRHALPARDSVSRWEGDEFLVVLSADPVAADAALKRVTRTINGHPIRTSAGPIEATLSAGAAPWLVGQDLEDAISRAGRALRTAKESGPAQIVLDTGPSLDRLDEPAS
jgi:diguanylate cyclase (GGDEF)-like protein